MKKIFVVLAAVFLLTIIACSGGGGGSSNNSSGGNETTNNTAPVTPSVGATQSGTASSVVSSSGGSVELTNVAKVTIPTGALSNSQTVVVSATSNSITGRIFDYSANDLFDAAARQPYEVRINLGTSGQPASAMDVSVTLPDSFISALPADASIVAFAEVDIEEDISQFVPVNSTYDQSGKIVTLSLSPEYFSTNNSSDGTYEAVIIIGYVINSSSSASTILKQIKKSASPQTPFGPSNVGMNSPLINKLQVVQGGAHGVGDGAFGTPRTNATGKHQGVDFSTTTGVDQVIAAHDGTINWRIQTNTKTGLQDANEGYGNYAIIRHKDKTATLYAHLKEIGNKTTVKKGEEFAIAGQSGNATDKTTKICYAPHLHFEYIPKPTGDMKDWERIDPVPHIQKISYASNNQNSNSGKIIVGNNQTVQLYAYTATANSINSDSNGNPIPLEDLKWSLLNPTSDASLVSIDANTGIITTNNKSGTVTVIATQSSSGIDNISLEVDIAFSGQAPSTPADFSVTAASSSQINLAWTAPTGTVTGYKVYKSGTYLKSVTTTSTSDTGLSASTNYCYYVTAYNSAGESVQTSQLCDTTQSVTYTYYISGRVTLNGSGLSGVTITLTLTGAGSTSTLTNSSGNYSFSSAANGSYTVTPSKTGYTFSPVNRTANVSGANFTVPDFVATATASTGDYTSANIGTLKYVPAGSFQRDTTSTNISTISTAFRMSEYEITRTQFLAIMGTDPSYTQYSSGTSDPVQMTNWYHAIAFCNNLSIAEGLTPVYSVSGINFTTLTYAAIPTTTTNTTWDAATANWSANGYRLPTEMEWMWAAMGSTSGYGYTGGTYTTGYNKAFAGSTGSNAIGDYAWYSDNSGSTTHPVGTKLANELGLYDMSGNVWEWCWDWYDTYPTGTQTNYRGAASGTTRVIRGGGWGSGASIATVAIRINGYPHSQGSSLGFRVVRP